MSRDSYLILELLCPFSLSGKRGGVVCPFVVILLHCMKRMTAVRGDRERRMERGGGQTGREAERRGEVEKWA